MYECVKQELKNGSIFNFYVENDTYILCRVKRLGEKPKYIPFTDDEKNFDVILNTVNERLRQNSLDNSSCTGFTKIMVRLVKKGFKYVYEHESSIKDYEYKMATHVNFDKLLILVRNVLSN